MICNQFPLKSESTYTGGAIYTGFQTNLEILNSNFIKNEGGIYFP